MSNKGLKYFDMKNYKTHGAEEINSTDKDSL